MYNKFEQNKAFSIVKKALNYLIPKYFAVCILLSLTFATVQSVYSAVGIRETINFQGKLVNSAGLNVADGSYSVVFSLYTVSSGGTNIWQETQNVSTVDGLFRVELGSVSSLSSVNFNNDSLYLGIKVGADAEMTPRVRYTATPYAFQAKNVSWSGLQSPNANTSLSMAAYTTSLLYSGTSGSNDLFVLSSSANSTGTGRLMSLRTATDSEISPFHVSAKGIEALFVSNLGRVGIGTVNPQKNLDIQGNARTSLSFVVGEETTPGIQSLYFQRGGGSFGEASISGGVYFIPGDSWYHGSGNGGTSIQFSPGGLNFLTAQPGEPGDPATLTQRMVIKAVTGNVGIGTDNPSARLQVAGAITASGIITGTGSGLTNLNASNITSGTIPTASVAGTYGNITGVGTLTSLNVSGSITSGSITSNSIISGTTFRSSLGSLGTPSYSFTGDDNTGIFSPGADILGFVTSGTERMRITSNGNVGIGTTAPNHKLVVEDNLDDANVFRIRNLNPGSTASSILRIGNNTLENMFDASAWSSGFTETPIRKPNGVSLVANGGGGLTLSASDANGTIRLFTGGENATNQRMTILSNGNVGIGTVSPTTALVVDGTKASGFPAISGSTQTGDILRLTGASDLADVTIDFGTAYSGSNYFGWLQATNKSSLGVNYNLLLNPNGGNVGIGTVSPSSQLDIFGTTAGLQLSYDANDYGRFTVASDGALTLSGVSGGGALTNIARYSTSQINMDVPTSFNSAGDVSMAYDLYLSNQTASAIKSDGPLTIQSGEAFENLNLTLKASGQGNLIVQSKNIWADGTNVGIGTTNPAANLSVSTTSLPSGTISLGNHLNGKGILFQADAEPLNAKTGIFTRFSSSPQGINAGMVMGRYGSAWGTYVAFHTHQNNSETIDEFAERMRIDGAGNVGIGTASPTDKLNIVTTAAYGGLTLESTVASNYQTALNFKHPNGSTSGRLGYDQNTDSIKIMNLSTWSGTGADILFYTNNDTTTPKMAISRAGNVGIGTTNPQARLQVVGAITASGIITGTGSGLTNLNASNITSGTIPTASVVNISGTAPNANTLTTARTIWGQSFNGSVNVTGALTGVTDLTASGIISGTTFRSALGSLGTPSYSFTGDVNTGIFSPGADILGFVTSGTERMRITSAGNVGIGTTNPATFFNLGGPLAKSISVDNVLNRAYFGVFDDDAVLGVNRDPTSGSFFSTSKTASYISIGGSTGNGYINFFATNTANTTPPLVMRISGNGNVGIGTASPGRTLHVAGTARITTSFDVLDDRTLCTAIASGDIELKSGACGTSSIRYKENVKNLSYGLSEIKQLRSVVFNYKNFDHNTFEGRTKNRIGFIAEEMVNVIPEVVIWNEENQIDGIDYAFLTSVLTKGIQEQQLQIEAQSSALQALDPKILDLENTLAQIELERVTAVSQEEGGTAFENLYSIVEDTVSRVVSLENSVAEILSRIDSLVAPQISASDSARIEDLSQRMSFVEAMFMGELSTGLNSTASAQLAMSISENEIIFDRKVVAEGNLSVLGETNLGDVGVTGNITNNMLVINGFDESLATPGASLNTLAGALNIQSSGLNSINFVDGSFKMDTDGNFIIHKGNLEVSMGSVKGNDGIRGINVSVGQSQVEMRVNFKAKNDTENYAVGISPSWFTNFLVSGKDENGFTVKFSTPAPQGAKFDWIVIE